MADQMTITVKPDIIRYAKHTQSYGNEHIERGFGVRGCAYLAGVIDASGATTRALFATGVPNVGDPHPVRGIPCVNKVIQKADGYNDMDVLVTYDFSIPQPNTLYKLSIGSGLIQKLTNKDITGALAKVTFTPGAGAKFPPFIPDLTRFIPTMTLTVDTVELQSPEKLASYITGSTNAQAWRGYGKRTWLVHSISGETTDNIRYTCRRIFMYNPETWDVFAVFKAENGKIPGAITIPTTLYPIGTDDTTISGNGWGRFQVARPVDFTFLFPYAAPPSFPGIP